MSARRSALVAALAMLLCAAPASASSIRYQVINPPLFSIYNFEFTRPDFTPVGNIAGTDLDRCIWEESGSGRCELVQLSSDGESSYILLFASSVNGPDRIFYFRFFPQALSQLGIWHSLESPGQFATNGGAAVLIVTAVPDPAVVPEPSSLLLLTSGLGALLSRRKRRP